MISMVKIAILIVFNHEGNNSKIVVRKGGREGESITEETRDQWSKDD